MSPNTIRTIAQMIVGASVAICTLIGGALLNQTIYFIRQRIPKERARGGRPPKKQPFVVWLLFGVCAIIPVLYPLVDNWVIAKEKEIALIEISATQTAISRQITPTPIPRMIGDFNIAVANFDELDLTGQVITSTIGQDLAASVYKLMKDTTQDVRYESSITTTLDIEIWPPNQVDAVRGNTHQERARSARAIVQKNNIDVLIYGRLQSSPENSTIIPEFFINERKLQDAEELIGEFSLGTSIIVPGNINNDLATRQLLRGKLIARTSVLAQFVNGLSWYSIDNLHDAEIYFRHAEQTPGWDKHDGKEVLYLFLGHIMAKRQNYVDAYRYYHEALALNSEYSRAQLGLAEVQFHESRKGNCEKDTTDARGLETAIKALNDVIQSKNQPKYADINVKAAYLLGRSYFCLSYAGADDKWDIAKQEFYKVIKDFEQGNERSRRKAVEAYGFLGIIYLSLSKDNTDYHRAAVQFKIAVQISRQPERQAFFSLWLAQVYYAINDCETAEFFLSQADSFTLSEGSSKEYSTFRADIIQRKDQANCQQGTPTPAGGTPRNQIIVFNSVN